MANSSVKRWQDQLLDMAARRQVDKAELERWLAPNLS